LIKADFFMGVVYFCFHYENILIIFDKDLQGNSGCPEEKD